MNLREAVWAAGGRSQDGGRQLGGRAGDEVLAGGAVRLNGSPRTTRACGSVDGDASAPRGEGEGEGDGGKISTGAIALGLTSPKPASG